jgi:hypothetical protein
VSESAAEAEVGLPKVWVFHGEDAQFASGVFGDRDAVLHWVARHQLTGIVTQYPLGTGCYDVAVAQGRFYPTKLHHGTPEHIAGFLRRAHMSTCGTGIQSDRTAERSSARVAGIPHRRDPDLRAGPHRRDRFQDGCVGAGVPPKSAVKRQIELRVILRRSKLRRVAARDEVIYAEECSA